jgi:hypothetical protein
MIPSRGYASFGRSLTVEKDRWICYDICRTAVTSDLISVSDCCGNGGTTMDHTMDDVKRMLHKAVEIMRSGLAEDATDEDKAKMQMLVSDDYRVVNAMIESLLAPDPEEEK